MKKIFYWKNIEPSVYSSLFVATFFSIILWGLMWNDPMFIFAPIIWTIVLIIAYYLVIKDLLNPSQLCKKAKRHNYRKTQFKKRTGFY